MAGAIGALVRTTGWPLEYIMNEISLEALTLISEGIAETYQPSDREFLG